MIIALLLAANGAVWAVHSAKPRRAHAAYVALRATAISAQARQVPGRFILFLGDSHAERAFVPQLCGLPVLNAGVGGVTADMTAELLRSLPPTGHLAAAVVFVGTNDSSVRATPLAEGAITRYRESVLSILSSVASRGGHLVFAGIPTVRHDLTRRFSPEARTAFSDVQKDVCSGGGCGVVPVFANVTENDFERDGVHLKNYARFVYGSEAELCEAAHLTRQISLPSAIHPGRAGG